VARAARELLFPLDFAVGESLHTTTTLRRPPHTHTFFVSSSSSSSERSFLSFSFFLFPPLSSFSPLLSFSSPRLFFSLDHQKDYAPKKERKRRRN
jgi:hypothetical protein